MPQQNKRNDEHDWINLIDRCLGTRKNYTPEQRELFALCLIETVPQVLPWSETVRSDNEDIKYIREKVQDISSAANALLNMKSSPHFLAELEISALYREGFEDMSLHKIRNYAWLLEDFVEDTYSLTSRPGKNNHVELSVCKAICALYERCLGEQPGLYNQRRANDSGDVMDGTPYERVCAAVGDRYGIDLSWSAQKQARKDYKEKWLNFFPDDKVDEIPPDKV